MAKTGYFKLTHELVEKINTSLNIALSLALVHARSQHAGIMEAATRLDDEINDDRNADEL